MRIEQDNFRHLLTGYLPGATQAQHMFRMLTATLVPDASLAGKERLESFTLQILQQSNGGDITVAVRA